MATAALEHLFWDRGYRGTCVEELAAAAGVSVSSLYAAYGNKQAALEAALIRYEQDMGEMLAVMEQGSQGLADVASFLGRLEAELSSVGHGSGCLMVNTMVELGSVVPEVAAMTTAYRRRVENALASALERAASGGEIPADTVDDRARLLQAAVFGLLVSGRAGDAASARDAIGSLTAELGRWR